MPRGGARPGAGRPKKQRSGAIYHSAEEYLSAVACGHEEPDAQRIQAAKALLAYEKPKQRAKPAAKPVRQLESELDTLSESMMQEEWRRKAEAIRAKHAKRQGGNDGNH